VENPLYGPCGTAAVFAPQKGASPTEVDLLEAGLRQLAHAVESSPEPPIGAAGAATAATATGAGAAGGLGYAALVLGAEYVSGAEFALGVTHGPARLAGSLLAVTGEGSLDAQSLRGKAPRVVAAAAAAAGVPTIAVVGRNLLEESQLREAGIAACFALLDRDAGCARSEPQSVRALTAIGEEIGAVLTSTVRRSAWNRDQRDLAARLERRRSGMQVSRSAHP
jgi:glycerate kinase